MVLAIVEVSNLSYTSIGFRVTLSGEVLWWIAIFFLTFSIVFMACATNVFFVCSFLDL